MKFKPALMTAIALAATYGGDIPQVKRPRSVNALPPTFRDSEKIRAAAAKRERRAKRGW